MKDNKLKYLIQSIELDRPSSNFTFKVMEIIYTIEPSWFKRTLPYLVLITIFCLITSVMLFFNVSLEPQFISEFFSSNGLEFINLLNLFKLTTIGLIGGICSSILLYYNKLKLKT